MKRMKVARGTQRSLRRKAALAAAAQFGVDQKLFARFWRLGATAEAAVLVMRKDSRQSIAQAA